jgi:hypothetical protein
LHRQFKIYGLINDQQQQIFGNIFYRYRKNEAQYWIMHDHIDSFFRFFFCIPRNFVLIFVSDDRFLLVIMKNCIVAESMVLITKFIEKKI